MSDPSALLPRLIPVRDLPKAAKTTRQDAATKAERAAIAEAFGLLELAALTFDYSLKAEGDDGWRVAGTLRATVSQACVVTLEPVTGQIRETFDRVFAPGGV
ncbi:MAG: DUF177 domain-containing protein, partial [Pseudomonadota bacterium]